MRTKQIFKVPAISSADSLKHRCPSRQSFSSFFFLSLLLKLEKLSSLVRLQFMKRISSVYFFPFLNTYKFQYSGGLGGKTVQDVLSFYLVYFADSFLLRGSGVLLNLAGRHLLSSVQGFFPLFSGVSATASTHLVTSNAVPELSSFRRRASPESLASDQPVLSQQPPS